MTARTLALSLPLILLLGACAQSVPPPTREHVILEGDSYARGLQHGQQLRSRIRSFHSTLLTSTLLPYLNREHAQIAAALPEYQKERYANGQFSHHVLLDSAKELERSIPFAYRDEMRGIADGSGLAYEDVLVLNTFVDTVLSVRGIAAALHLSDAPRLIRVEVPAAGTDGADNDEDGEVDEAEEGVLAPFAPSAYASLSRVPRGATVRLVLEDVDGVDDATVRIVAGERVFVAGDPSLVLSRDAAAPATLMVDFTPPAELTGGEALRVSVLAGDQKVVSDPPPAHARFMRGERIAFALEGSDRLRREVGNFGPADGTQPSSLAFALRGTATADGAPLLAHSFALLDANTSHKHTAVFEHRLPGGERVAVVGWAGLVWGFSGMNAAGVAVACNHSDTLDNAVLQGFIEQIGDLDNARLVARGRPLGIALRRVLEQSAQTADAVAELSNTEHPFGWNCLTVDDQGRMQAVEVDSGNSGGASAFTYSPEIDGPGNVNPDGLRWASHGPDDLRIGAHFQKNTEDMYEAELVGKRVLPQRKWSSYYFRSLDGFFRLGDALKAAPPLNAQGAQALLATPALEDQRDGMNAVVFEPRTRTLHVAAGAVPATSAGFETYSLEVK